MNQVKTLGLAAVAATALMAFAGAGPASATVLCKTNLTSGCGAAGWDYPAGTEIHASLEWGTKAVFETTGGFLRDECTESTIKGSTANTGSSSETVTASVSAANLTFGGCTSRTAAIEGGELEVHSISGTDNGTLTAKGFKITVEFAGEDCFYTTGTGTDLGTVTGGPMGTIDISAVVMKTRSGVNCLQSALWTAKYTVTSPEPLFVSTN